MSNRRYTTSLWTNVHGRKSTEYRRKDGLFLPVLCFSDAAPLKRREHQNESQRQKSVLMFPGLAASWTSWSPRHCTFTSSHPHNMSYVAKKPSIGVGSPKCPTCGKTVYFNEQVIALDKAWHQRCLKCAQCSKVLDAGSLNDRDGALPLAVGLFIVILRPYFILYFCRVWRWRIGA